MKTLTQNQTNEIRNLVKSGGWNAVKNHPVLSIVWKNHQKEQKKYTDWILGKF